MAPESSQRDKDQQLSDLDIQNYKLLLKHMLQVYQGIKDREEDSEVYQEILFNLLISKQDFSLIENLNDFIELLEGNLGKIVDIDSKFEILFVEQDMQD